MITENFIKKTEKPVTSVTVSATYERAFTMRNMRQLRLSVYRYDGVEKVAKLILFFNPSIYILQ